MKRLILLSIIGLPLAARVHVGGNAAGNSGGNDTLILLITMVILLMPSIILASMVVWMRYRSMHKRHLQEELRKYKEALDNLKSEELFHVDIAPEAKEIAEKIAEIEKF